MSGNFEIKLLEFAFVTIFNIYFLKRLKPLKFNWLYNKKYLKFFYQKITPFLAEIKLLHKNYRVNYLAPLPLFAC